MDLKRRLSMVISVISLLATVAISPITIAAIKQQRVPGGLAIIKLNHHSPTPPRVYYHNKRVLVIRTKHKHAWQAIVGIPLNSKIGWQQVRIYLANGKQYLKSFKIYHTHYRVQRLHINNKRKVTPNARDRQRIRRERSAINRILSHWYQQQPSLSQFRWPIKGPITSSFGLRRFFNNQPRAPHSGLDIAAPPGKSVRVTAPGRVAATGNFFYTGNTIFVDHGQGAITIYCHLSKINVHPGQQLRSREIIGKVGQTGRVTGPHLHWTVILNQTHVNPLLFVDNPKPNKRRSRSRNG